MRQKNGPKRTKQFHIYLTPEEREEVQKRCKSTTCRSLAQFLRARVLQQPETVLYRNQSADEFLPIAIRLKNELTPIGKQLMQAIVDLRLAQDKQGIKIATANLEAAIFSLELHIHEIKTRLNQIYEQWWQK